MNARLSGALVDAAAVYGLDEDGLADLAAFASRHPDLPARVAQRVKERCRELGVANPARALFVDLPLERMESLASRVLTGTFDEEFLAYCDARMTHYDDLGYEPRYMFPWATIVPVEVGRTATDAGLDTATVHALVAAASGACTLTIVEMMRVFMASRERRLVSIDHLLAASVELAALGQSIADLTAADGSSALTFRVAAASDALGVVKTRAQLIDDTVRLIQRIAAQTNMLALNATIEAARAGQHGRAFSVVANEVKELSVSTRDALDQINKLVDALKGSVEDAGRAVGGVHGVVVQLAGAAAQISDLSARLANGA